MTRSQQLLEKLYNSGYADKHFVHKLVSSTGPKGSMDNTIMKRVLAKKAQSVGSAGDFNLSGAHHNLKQAAVATGAAALMGGAAALAARRHKNRIRQLSNQQKNVKDKND